MSYKLNVHINRSGILIVCLLYINSISCVYWTPNLYTNYLRYRRQATSCDIYEFACKDGSCIPDYLQCDGKDDCKDGTDEDISCKEIACNASFGYQCAYGACVKKDAKCNGIKECKDNSDEIGCDNNVPTTNVCAINQFSCRSGDCIDEDKACDGKADCSDNSDETQEECSDFNCVNAYRCKYGACTIRTARCNGVKECFDGSDEAGCTSINTSAKPPTPRPTPTPTKPTPKPTPKPPTDGSCLVPRVPANGVFVNSNKAGGTFKPGDYVPNFNALITNCDRRFKTTPPHRSFPICFNGKWTSPPLECGRYCRSANSTKTTKITCKFGNIPLDSCSDPVEGTIASIVCEHLYEGQSGNPTRICKEGSWDYPISECSPACGRKTPIGKPNIINGSTANIGDYPWHVGIYENTEVKSLICGGSILNQLVIISAAHCFTDNDGNLNAKENYLIAAGKYYRPYDDDRDEYAQYATVKELHKPDRYKGQVGNYEADIVIVILSKPFGITISVQPVCVDWNTEFEYQQLAENNVGVVVGWGYTQKGSSQSIELKELNTPYISYDQCFEQVPKDFRRFLTYDKICAGFLHKGVAVCQGDSGGGLTFPRRFDDRYYIRGVVSTSPRSESSCDPNQYATYTLISRHIDFIKDIEIVNRIFDN